MNDWLRWTLMEFQDSISGLDLQSSSHSITLHDFIEERVFTSRETIEQLPNWRGIECGESCVTLRFTIRVESGESLQSVLITRRWSDVNKSNCFRESKEIWKFHSIEKRISFTSSIDFRSLPRIRSICDLARWRSHFSMISATMNRCCAVLRHSTNHIFPHHINPLLRRNFIASD